MRDILAWVLTIEVTGLAALPLLRAFFANRRDAALLSRPIGLALVAYVGWALTLLPRIPFERRLLFIALLLVGAVSYLLRRRGRAGGAVRERLWGAEERRALAFFWGSAAVFLVIRAAVPEILGAEKFMDLAFFNSLSHHGAMPPLDPWMSGRTINYYYWGYLLAAVLAKLSAVTPMISYNLAIATFAGYSFCAAASLAARLSGGSFATSLAGGGAAVFAGNLQGAIDAWRAPFARDFDYWHASRVIAKGDTINEFPFFTFFHADLHPHLLAFPYFVAAFAVAHRLFEGASAVEGERPAGPARAVRAALPYLFAAWVGGTAIAANTWNAPAVAILLLFAGAFRRTGGRAVPRPGPLFSGALAGGGAALAALLLWRPYAATYALPYNGIAPNTPPAHSALFEWLGVWGILLAVAVAALWGAGSARDESGRRLDDLRTVVAAAVSLAAAFFSRSPALFAILFAAFLAARAAVGALRADPPRPAALYAAFLLLLALAMIGGCEFIHFKDSYGEQLQRMNTIFKFYHQAWPLFAVAAVVFAGDRLRGGRAGVGRRALFAAAALLALFYPVNAAVSRLRQRVGPFTLDARAALARRSPGDAAAVAWLEARAHRRSVLLEAAGDPYRDFARISSHTGVPAVLGWANHELLWRSNDAEISRRLGDVTAFYAAPDEAAAYRIAERYGVEYVVLGELERSTYPGADRVSEYVFLEAALPGPTSILRVRRPR